MWKNKNKNCEFMAKNYFTIVFISTGFSICHRHTFNLLPVVWHNKRLTFYPFVYICTVYTYAGFISRPCLFKVCIRHYYYRR